MTVCIAALGGDGAFVVVVSDRMVTANPPPIEFEHNAPKITKISARCVVLTSGDALAHVELCNEAINTTAASRVLSTRRIAQEIQKAYVSQREEKIEAEYLRPRGWTIKSFYDEHARALPGEITFAVDRQIATYEHELSVIVAGVDEQGQGHVYGISNPGVLECWDGMGAYAIGIGASYAITTFFLNNWRPNMALGELIFMAYEAKRRAEVAPGVGKATDMAYITQEGMTHLGAEHFEGLDKAFLARYSPSSDKSDKIVAEMFPLGGDKNGERGQNSAGSPEGARSGI